MELFTNFVIETIPQVEFAHTYETDNYALSFPIREDFLELSYFEESDAILESENGKKVHIPSNSIYFHYYLEKHHISSKAHQLHHTVAFRIKYRIIDEPVSNCISVPSIITDPILVKKASEIIKSCIKKLLYSQTNDLELSGLVLELLSLFQYKNKRAHKKSNMSNASIGYVERAENYILDNLKTKFTVKDIADYIGISDGYLSDIFHKLTGTTIIKYANKKRLEIAINLVKNESASLKEACNICGISDPNYLSRMFKKYMNTSISKIKEQNKVINS